MKGYHKQNQKKGVRGLQLRTTKIETITKGHDLQPKTTKKNLKERAIEIKNSMKKGTSPR